MGTADGIGIHLAKSEMQYLAFSDQFVHGLSDDLNRSVRVRTMLVKHTESFYSKIAKRILAHLTYIVGRTIFLCLDLYAIHKLMPKFSSYKYPVRITFQRFAN